MRRFSGAACCLLLAYPGWLAAAPADGERAYFDELPVVLSASRLPQSVALAPAAITVIDREMIRASGLREIPDLLRLAPGFQVTYQQGNFASVTYHGLSGLFSRAMQVRVDGRSIYNPAFGNVDWRSLPLAIDDIERIEVVRGPNAANDGSNAFLATINIVTRHSAQDAGSHGSFTGGDYGVRDTTLRHGGRLGRLDYRLTLAARRDDRFPTLPDNANDRFVNFRGDYRADARNELMAQLGVSRGDWGKGRTGFNLSPPRRAHSENAAFQLRWRHAENADNEWSLNLHHDSQSLRDRFTLLDLASGIRDFFALNDPGLAPFVPVIDLPANLDYRIERSGMEYAALSRPLQALRLSWGGELRREAGRSPAYTNTERTFSGDVYRLFGAAEWQPAPAWLLHGAAMAEKHYYGGTNLSPRLALNYQPATEHTLRLGAARSYRMPSFLEQNIDTRTVALGQVVNRDTQTFARLRPERIDTVELGYVFHRPAAGLQADARLFRNRVRNIIDLQLQALDPAVIVAVPPLGSFITDTAIKSFANLHDARQTGLDWSLRWRPLPTTWLVWNQYWNRTRSDTSRYADSAPRAGFGLLAARDFGAGWSGSLGFYGQSAMTWVSDPEGNPATVPRHRRLDLRLAKAWRSGRADGEAALVLQNALHRHLEFPPDRYFDRRLLATLAVDF